MKTLLTVALTLFSLSSFATDPGKKNPKIKIYKDELEKIYTVFFADTVEHDITVSVSNKKGVVLVTEKFHAKGFNKPYGLSGLSNGQYSFSVEYGDENYVETITLKSKKQITEESITLETSYPNLKINVNKYSMAPMNIMVMDTDDNLLKMFYWKPNETFSSKTVDLEQFSGYEIVVQVIQDGENKLEQLVKLH